MRKLFKIFMLAFMFTVLISPINTVLNSKDNIVYAAKKKKKPKISQDQKRMLQATTQIALERNGFENDTSSQLKNWTFAKNNKNKQILWNSITTSNKNGKIKTIFQWTGKDTGKEKDDLILVYLLVGGNEIVNDLNE